MPMVDRTVNVLFILCTVQMAQMMPYSTIVKFQINSSRHPSSPLTLIENSELYKSGYKGTSLCMYNWRYWGALRVVIHRCNHRFITARGLASEIPIVIKYYLTSNF